MTDFRTFIWPSQVGYIIVLVFLTLLTVLVPRTAFPLSATEVKQVQAKAEECQKKLSAAMEDGKNVSDIVSMMMQAKALADAGRLPEADELLDGVLLKFDRIYGKKETLPSAIDN